MAEAAGGKLAPVHEATTGRRAADRPTHRAGRALTFG